MIKISKHSWLFAASFFLATLPAQSAEIAPKELVGKFGFDWLRPEKAKCAVLTEKTAAGIKSCKQQKADEPLSFTGKSDFYVCKISDKSEYMIYSSQARCLEELETMQANGP